MLGLDDAARAIEEMALAGGGRTVHLCSANNLGLASKDPAYAEVLNRGSLNLPDGAALVLAAHRAGIFTVGMANRPRGADVLTTTVGRGRARGLRHYLYGTDSHTVATLQARLERRFPGAAIVGAEAPPFRELTAEEEAEVVERVVAARPHIVWVALGAPGQDHWADAMRGPLGVTLVAVGAAFDFVAGTKREAPKWVQRSGLEWLFRLLAEPRRLWKRYLHGNLVFLRCLSEGVDLEETPFDG